MVSFIDVFLDLTSDLICLIAKGWLDLKHVAVLDCAYCNSSRRSVLYECVYKSPNFALSVFPQLSDEDLVEGFMKWFFDRSIRVEKLCLGSDVDRTLPYLRLTQFGKFIREIELGFVNTRKQSVCLMLKDCTHLERLSCTLCKFNQATIDAIRSCSTLHTFQTKCCVDGWGKEFIASDINTLSSCSNIRNAELCLESSCLMMLCMLKTIESTRIERLLLSHVDLWDSDSEHESNSDDSLSKDSGVSDEDELDLVSNDQSDSDSGNDDMQDLDTSKYEPILFLRLKKFLSQSTQLKLLSIDQPKAGFERKIVELLQVCSPQVQDFSLVDADYTDWAVTSAVFRFAHLKSIDMTNAGSLTDATLHEIATHCWQTLVSLYTAVTEGCTNEGYRAVFETCHLLRSFSFSDDTCIDVTLLSNLTSLLIHYPYGYGEPVSTSLVDIATHCPNLHQLNVSYDGVGNGDEVDFSEFSGHNAPCLTILRFSGLYNCSLELLGELRPRLKIIYGVNRLKHPFEDDMMTTPL